MDNLEGWHSIATFDPSPGGAFVATYSDGSGAIILFATDNGEVLDGESWDEVHDFNPAVYSLYSWLPDDFVTWGQTNG